jgi:hypothetical protein
MPDNRAYLANLRFAKAALNSAADLLIIKDSEENENLTVVCQSISEKARCLANMLEHEENILTNLT